MIGARLLVGIAQARCTKGDEVYDLCRMEAMWEAFYFLCC